MRNYLSEIFARRKVLVSRVKKSNGEHCYSILADSSGFEYLFPTGVRRWSTVGPSMARMHLEFFRAEIEKRKTKGKTMKSVEYLRMAQPESGWYYSKPYKYASRNEAIEIEVAILDAERQSRPDSHWM